MSHDMVDQSLKLYSERRRFIVEIKPALGKELTDACKELIAVVDRQFERVAHRVSLVENGPGDLWGHPNQLKVSRRECVHLEPQGYYGAGGEWDIVTRWSDQQTLEALRSIQRVLVGLRAPRQPPTDQ